jgi:hypothetical protein
MGRHDGSIAGASGYHQDGRVGIECTTAVLPGGGATRHSRQEHGRRVRTGLWEECTTYGDDPSRWRGYSAVATTRRRTGGAITLAERAGTCTAMKEELLRCRRWELCEYVDVVSSLGVE